MLRFTIITLFSLLVSTGSLWGQTHVQDIRGAITDIHTGISLPGATVILTSTEPVRGTTTDVSGRFSFSDIPVGRHSLQVSFMGYKTFEINNFLVQSGRESFLEIRLEESVQMLGEVTVEHKVPGHCSTSEQIIPISSHPLIPWSMKAPAKIME